jgi:hypothetical protein
MGCGPTLKKKCSGDKTCCTTAAKSPCANCYDPGHPADGSGTIPDVLTFQIPAGACDGAGCTFAGSYVCRRNGTGSTNCTLGFLCTVGCPSGAVCCWSSDCFDPCGAGLPHCQIFIFLGLGGPGDNTWTAILMFNNGGAVGDLITFNQAATMISGFFDCSSQNVTFGSHTSRDCTNTPLSSDCWAVGPTTPVLSW